MKDVSKLASKLIGWTWLHQEGGAALALGSLTRGCPSIIREDHHGDVSRPRVVLNLSNEIPAVGLWQEYLCDDHVGMNRPGLLVGVRAIASSRRLEAETLERDRVEFARVVMTVHEKHYGLVGG